MEITLITIGIVLLLVYFWLGFLASIAIHCDETLVPVQRVVQWITAWLFPFIGSSFILHLVFQHSPEAIPRTWIPWPFKSLIFGKYVHPSRDRDENEDSGIDLAVSKRYSDHHDYGSGEVGGGDGGGGGE